MKKISLFILFSAVFLCCASCAEYQKKQAAIVSYSYVFPTFNKIAVSGNARIELVDKGGQPYLYCNGTKRDVDHIGARVKADTLYISSSSKAPYIKLNVHNPKLLSVADHAYVVGHLTAKNLQIIASGAGAITLQGGKLGLTTITQKGSGKLDLKWIDSPFLTINSSNRGPIYLAGVARNVEAKLRDHTYLEARYLRATVATVLATDHVQAHVLAKDTLGAYADDTSNIYYHKRPLHLNKVSKDSGNVFLLSEIQ